MERQRRQKRPSLRALAPIGAGVAAITCGLIALALQQSPHATAATLTTTTSSSTMAGMSSGSSMTGSAGMATVKGASLPSMPTSGAMPTAMPMVPLGQATWKGMKIEARTSAPATFELFDGTSQQLVRPTAKTSFHLMVLLSDASTGVAIPYSSVWATVRKGGKIVFDERLWPMISRYMGPHYGNNVSLPSAGVYQVSLLISPPQAARHLEYKNLWLKPHKVNLAFRWVPKT